MDLGKLILTSPLTFQRDVPLSGPLQSGDAPFLPPERTRDQWAEVFSTPGGMLATDMFFSFIEKRDENNDVTRKLK